MARLMMKLPCPTLLLVALLLPACVTGPRFDIADVEQTLKAPRDVVAMTPFPAGERVLWGGVIVAVKNLPERSRLEVLAYPLDHRQRPMPDEPSLGRFVLEKAGYLEPADHAPGRFVTVVGRLRKTLRGRVGEARYDYPLVEADSVYLWPLRSSRPAWGDIHLGFGISISN